MIRNIILGITAIILTGCSNESEVQELVRSQLKDPDSAKFGDLIVSTSKKTACIYWNAKNSFGGYTEGNIAELSKDGDSWIIIKLESPYSSCTQDDLDSSEDKKIARLAGIAEAKELLSKAIGNSSENDTKCLFSIFMYGRLAESLSVYKKHPETAKKEIADLEKKIDKAKELFKNSEACPGRIIMRQIND